MENTWSKRLNVSLVLTIYVIYFELFIKINQLIRCFTKQLVHSIMYTSSILNVILEEYTL